MPTMPGILILVAYLVGSIPIGLLLGFVRGVDIRQHGSGNIGATNTMRVLGKRIGLTCFFLDMLKGAGPVVIAGLMLDVLGSRTPDEAAAWWWLGVALATVLGHVFPVWLRFKGGKGVATGFGAMLGLWPIVTLAGVAAFVVWLLVVKVTRYVSLGSIAGAASLPAAIALLAAWSGNLAHSVPFIISTGGLALLVLVRHRGNLARLMRGEEPKSNAPIESGKA